MMGRFNKSICRFGNHLSQLGWKVPLMRLVILATGNFYLDHHQELIIIPSPIPISINSNMLLPRGHVNMNICILYAKFHGSICIRCTQKQDSVSTCINYCTVHNEENNHGRQASIVKGKLESNTFNMLFTINPFTPELKKCILPTFQKAIVWVM